MTLDDRIWQRILTFVRQQPDVHVGNETDCRCFIGAVLWMTHSSAQWRLLPEHYGNWNSVYQHYNPWGKRVILQRMQQAFIEFADLENLLLDSTTVRAHACAAGAKKGDKPKPLIVLAAALAPRFMPSVTAWATSKEYGLNKIQNYVD